MFTCYCGGMVFAAVDENDAFVKTREEFTKLRTQLIGFVSEAELTVRVQSPRVQKSILWIIMNININYI